MMSTERLKTLRKQEQTQRKFTCVMNDVAKTQQILYEGYIDKEKHEAEQRSDKSIVLTKRNIVRQRVLKQCMRNKREEVDRTSFRKLYGQYGGEQVGHIASGIDKFLEQNHPKFRRRQKIEQLFEEGYRKGAILDDRTVHEKVESYFERPLVEFYRKPDLDNVQRNDKFPVLTRAFYTGHLQEDGYLQRGQESRASEDKLKSRESGKETPLFTRKVKKFLKEDIPDYASVQSEIPPFVPSAKQNRGSRPVTLPPIKIGTDNFVPPQLKSEDCISELIERLHRARNDREKEKKQKKERRAKRLQHERVFGVGHVAEMFDLKEMVIKNAHNNTRNNSGTDGASINRGHSRELCLPVLTASSK